MSSNQNNQNIGSFRPHPRASPNVKQQQSQHPQYPSTEEGFIPLGFSSPICTNKQRSDSYKFSPATSNYHLNNSWHKRPFYRGPSQSFQQKSRSFNDGGTFFHKQYYNKKNFNKTHNNDDIDAYYHPSMIEDPWKYLMENYNKSIKKEEVNSDGNKSVRNEDNVDSDQNSSSENDIDSD